MEGKKYNTNIFKYSYYNSLTVTDIRDSLLFPPADDKLDFLNITKKLNLTIRSTNPALLDSSLLGKKGYEFLNYDINNILSDGVEEFYKLIPVIVGIRLYAGKYYIQSKTVEREILLKEYEFLRDSELVNIEFVNGKNYILLEDGTRFYSEGTHFNFSIQAYDALRLGITIEEVNNLNIDYYNYAFIHVSLPETLYNLPSFIPNSFCMGSLETFKSRWLNMSALDLILNKDINDIKSHIVRKFVMDIKTNTIMLDDDDYDNTDNVKLVLDYLNRAWADELKYRVNEEFNGIVSSDFLSIINFKRFVILHRVTKPLKHINIPDTVIYSMDKNYILDTIFDKINEIKEEL